MAPNAPSPAEIESERSRRLLQLVVDSIPQRVFWKDLACRYLGCNAAFAHDAGLASPQEILGRDDFELAWRASAHLYRADDLEVMHSGRAKTDIEEPMTFPDGRTIWLRTNKVPLRDASGSVFGVLGTYEDVTGRREAAHALAESEERFRATFEQAAVGLAHVAEDGRWIRVNRRLCEMVGRTREELTGCHFTEVTHPDDVGEDRRLIASLLAGEIGSYQREKRYRRPDGSVVWVQVTVSLLRDAAGAPKYFIGVVEDCEARRRADAERRRLAEIVEQSTEAVVMTDVRGDITYVNRAFEQVTGYDRSEVEGRNPRLLSSGRHTQDFYAGMWSTLTGGGRWTGHFVNRRRDGSLFEEEATLFPVRDESGQIASFVAIKRDVTRESQLRGQLQQAQKMESIGRLAGGIAHDFNNLLTAILGFTDVVLADAQAPHRDALLQVRHAGERAAALTRQLLAFSRQQVLQPEELDLGAVVEGMESMLRRLLGEDVILHTVVPAAPARVRADRTQLEQVILNLAVNARDAMPEGGSLRIEVSRATAPPLEGGPAAPAPPQVELTVADTGCGMDEELQRRVFEPFFTTKPKGKGTGLGLATAYGIVQQTGGTISFTSAPGRGTTFVVRLPALPGRAAQAAAARESAGDTPNGSETILLVEDDAAVRGLARIVLESAGYAVICADSGAQALDAARRAERGIALVVTDVVMPEMSGRELARRLAEQGHEARVLYMSGYTDDVIARHGILEPGISFLQKPFSPAALTRRVREALDA